MEKRENIWRRKILFCREMKNGVGKGEINGEGKLFVGQTDVSDALQGVLANLKLAKDAMRADSIFYRALVNASTRIR